MKLSPLPLTAVQLGVSGLQARQAANRRYMMSLSSDLLLLPYRFEAGLWTDPVLRTDLHGGWESPTSQLRGHFLGHWLAAAARMAPTDREVRAKAEVIVDELAKCQFENGGEWVGSIPEKYLDWVAQGKPVWAPQYTLHKTFMGLLDFYQTTSYTPALEVAVRWSRWFHRWAMSFTEAQFDDILDYETGGMLEIWAELYGITGEVAHRELMDRYARRRLFNGLLAGVDVITNMHANTTIPEVLGAARAYEVTREPRWLAIVEAYWKQTVTDRGQFATGGQSCGEIWTAAGRLSARLGDKNQEHCTVYNMMRLADFLLRWTGESAYADYWETNLHNGVLAQGHWEDSVSTHGFTTPYPTKGLITYFLPLRGGARKGWSSETGHFFCCHGSLVQAHATHTGSIWYTNEAGLAVAQTIASRAQWSHAGVAIDTELVVDTQAGSTQALNPEELPTGAPGAVVFDVVVKAERAVRFELSIRLPEWLKGKARLWVNGQPFDGSTSGGWARISREWNTDVVRVEFPKGITVVPLPGEPDLVAFRDGPVLLAGLCEAERTLVGSANQPEAFLVPDNEREWRTWTGQFRTKGQAESIRFLPLKDIGYDRYTVYFRLSSAAR